MNKEKWNLELSEYIKQGETSRVEKARNWETAIGLQEVDGLKPTRYLLDTAKEHIEAMGKLNHIYDVKYQNGKLTLKCSGGKHNITHVIDYFAENNLDYDRIYSELPTLNDVFLEITGKELRDSE